MDIPAAVRSPAGSDHDIVSDRRVLVRHRTVAGRRVLAPGECEAGEHCHRKTGSSSLAAARGVEEGVGSSRLEEERSRSCGGLAGRRRGGSRPGRKRTRC